MLQVFIDDSGRGQGPAFVLSGYLASPEVWERFSREWHAELATEPSVKYFKMKEAASRTGEFAGHKRELVEFRVSNLVGIIERNGLKGVTVAVDREAFADIVVPYANTLPDHPKAIKMFANPYFLCFYYLIVMLLYAQKNLGAVEPVDFIFDEQGKEGRAIRDYWSVLRAMVPEDDVRDTMMAAEPVFRDDKTFLPLQAADLAAWQIRNLLNTVVESQADRIELNPIMTRLAAIPHLEYMIDRKRVRSFIQQYDQMNWAELESLL